MTSDQAAEVLKETLEDFKKIVEEYMSDYIPPEREISKLAVEFEKVSGKCSIKLIENTPKKGETYENPRSNPSSI